MRKDACLFGRIEQREAQQRGVTFQEDYRRLLKRYGIEYDERFVWD
jgi:transposase